MRLAVLITCYNRKAKTLRCLESLHAQSAGTQFKPSVWLVDDGSTDGTRATVAKMFPEVKCVGGTGNLFWCGGMRVAWEQASAENPEVFLWLNDDVVLAPDALSTLQSMLRVYPYSIVVGSCCSANSGARTYGGLRRAGRHPGKIAPVDPSAVPQFCDTFEGNIVLIPASVYAQVGSLQPFTHAMGDLDYGYRAAQVGVPIVLAPGFLGTCERNPESGSWRDLRLSRLQRLKLLLTVKGLPPRDWWFFCRSHGGLRAPFYFLSPFFRVVCGL